MYCKKLLVPATTTYYVYRVPVPVPTDTHRDVWINVQSEGLLLEVLQSEFHLVITEVSFGEFKQTSFTGQSKAAPVRKGLSFLRGLLGGGGLDFSRAHEMTQQGIDDELQFAERKVVC